MRTAHGLFLTCLAVAPAAAQTVVVDSVRLIDGTGRPPVANAALVIEGDRITRVITGGPSQYPRGAQVIHFPGRTVIPGLIDAHVHVGLVRGRVISADNDTHGNVAHQLERFVRAGVTTIAVLGLSGDVLYAVRDDVRADRLVGPEVLTADHGIGVQGGGPPFALPLDRIDRPDTPEAARADVRAAASRHADLVKVWVDDFYGSQPTMRPDISTAIIDEAHRHHLRVAAHVFYLADAKAMVAAGADILAHSVRDQPVDADLIAAMKAHGTWYVPTLTVDASFVVWADHPRWLADPLFRAATDSGVADWLASPAVADSVRTRARVADYRRAFATARANVKSLVDAGVRVGFGTDGGAFPSRVQGFAEHEELRMLVDAGLTPAQALATATRSNAELLGLGATIGTLGPGKRADLLVIDGDPLTDISATERIVAIWHAGRRIEPLVAAH